MANSISIIATDLNDAWFQALMACINYGHEYIIDRGSFESCKRRQLEFIAIEIQNPGIRPIIPTMPESCGLPAPTDMNYVNDYLSYIMEDNLHDKELYTYGCSIKRQIPSVIKMLKETPKTNQACITVGSPDSIFLKDPECLRLISLKLLDGKLNMSLFFRCLSGDTPILIKSNNLIIKTTIENLYNRFYQGEKIHVLGANSKCETNWTILNNINRNYFSNNYKISIIGGGEIICSQEHRFPVLNSDKTHILLKKPSEMNIGEFLLECNEITNDQLYDYSNTLDLYDILKNESNVFVCNLDLDDFKAFKKDNITFSNSNRDNKYINISSIKNSHLIKNNFKLKCCKIKTDRFFKITKEMSFFMGLWISDGTYHTNALRLCIGKGKEKNLERILLFLKNEFNYTPHIENRENNAYIINIAIFFLYKLFKNIGFIEGSHVKIFPNIMFSCTYDILESFIEGWFAGDGGTTVNIKLASSMIYVGKLLSKQFSIYTEKEKQVIFQNRIINSSKCYHVRSLNHNSIKSHYGDRFIKRKIKNIENLHDFNLMYDLSINSENKLFFCGNTPIMTHNSWDLLCGMPSNLAALQLFKEYLCDEIGCLDGKIYAVSDGLHLYDYQYEIAEARTGYKII